jgi:hypothetical protein
VRTVNAIKEEEGDYHYDKNKISIGQEMAKIYVPAKKRKSAD